MFSRTFMAATIWLSGATSVLARDKTDVVYFTNGDVIHCEIKKLERAKLTVKSIGFGTIAIEWDKIAHIESTHHFQLELQSGIRYLGTLAPGPEPGKLEVGTLAGTNRLDHSRIVVIRPVEETLWQRLDGSVDVGYDFTQASTATNWNLHAEVAYLTAKGETRVSGDSLLKTQAGAEAVERHNVGLTHIRFLRDRWFVAALAQGDRNANQALEFRGLVSGNVGRRLLQSNRTTISVLAGAAFSNEKYTDTDFFARGEAVGGVLFDTYRFNSPELEITVSALFLPNFDFSGRFRFQSDGSVRLELVKDLFWRFGYYESFDSDPPSLLASRNDFGLTTSFDWSF